MFRKASKDTLLPHSGNGRGGGGLYGATRATPKSSFSKSFIATIAWAMVSLSLVGGGWLYCSKKMEYTSVKCNTTTCNIEELKSGAQTTLEIPHARLVRAELVRVRNGMVVDPAKLPRSQQRKLGHTYSLVYVEADSEDDDDESYDSFADDDDSYDSYDDDDPSSDEGDDDEGDDDDEGHRGSSTKKAAATGGAGAKNLASSAQQKRREVKADRRATLERQQAQTRMGVEERVSMDPPVEEQDERFRERERERQREGNRHDEEERFPGDAGTMGEKNRHEIRKMAADLGMTAENHRERSARAYEEAARAAQARHQMDSQMRQIGNNLHDRAATPKPKPSLLSPDDPDFKPPAGGARPPPKDEDRATDGGDPNARAGGGGGGRTLSSVGGMEEVGTEDLEMEEVNREDVDEGRERRQLKAQDREDKRGVDGGAVQEKEGGGGVSEDNAYDTLGDFVQAGAAGARRKLLNYRERADDANPTVAKLSKEALDREIERERDVHRKGHGHHNKRPRHVAQPTGPEESSVPRPKTKHHHKAFHHKKDVPQEARHHVHHAYHRRPGEQKVEHGYKHMHRQWHGRREVKKVATSFSLGRYVAKKRKEAIDSYVSRRTTTVDFTDSKKWRAGGLWMMILGCISAAFCIVIGNFQPRPKNKKVS